MSLCVCFLCLYVFCFFLGVCIFLCVFLSVCIFLYGYVFGFNLEVFF